jgi:hypothetical protein
VVSSVAVRIQKKDDLIAFIAFISGCLRQYTWWPVLFKILMIGIISHLNPLGRGTKENTESDLSLFGDGNFDSSDRVQVVTLQL